MSTDEAYDSRLLDRIGRRFKVGERLGELAPLTVARQSSAEFIDGVLKLLLRMGFERARYYEVAYDVPTEGDLVVLTGYAPSENVPYSIGFQAPFSSSTLATQGDSLFPVVASPETLLGHASRDWFTALGLSNRCWVEIPLVSGGKPVAVIACDWHGSPSDLTSEDLLSLGLVGSLTAGHLALLPTEGLTEWLRILSRTYTEHDSLERLLESAANVISSSLRAAACAVFEYRWQTQTVYKMYEVLDPSVQTTSDTFREEYPVGEYLTGKAWRDARFHYIVDFPGVRKKMPSHVAPESLTRHTKLLGEVKTVMYAVIGNTERRFMLRFMNRADRPDLPFLSEKRRLDVLAADLGSAVDAMISQNRLHGLQRTARQAVDKLSEPRETLNCVTEGLQGEDVRSFAFLANSEGAVRLTFAEFIGPAFAKWSHDPAIEWKQLQSYAQAVRENAPAVLPLAEFARAGPGDILSEYLVSMGFADILAIPASAGTTSAALLVPLPGLARNSHRRGPLRVLNEDLPGTFRMINAYASLLCSAVEAEGAYMTAQGARRVLGYIGHELGTPIAILGDSADYALDLAAEVVAKSRQLESADRSQLHSQLAELAHDVAEQRDEIERGLEVARILAQESRGRLQLHFRRQSLAGLLQSAKERVERDLRPTAGARTQTQAVIQLSDSCRKLPETVCDGELVRQVFVNLIRNAVKYSLPRHPPQPRLVRVMGQPQTGVNIVQVENWGIGIPPDQFESIFRPFVRGTVEDSRKAIRGMGLGLFLSRRIMAAHKGQVFCRRSDATLNDPERLRRWEGFETVFEVRIPLNLQEETVTHEWREGGPSAR